MITVHSDEATSGLRSLRVERGLSLEAVSVLSGGTVDISTVSRIERGLVEPRPETVVRLARALGISAKRMDAIVRDHGSVGAGSAQ